MAFSTTGKMSELIWMYL